MQIFNDISLISLFLDRFLLPSSSLCRYIHINTVKDGKCLFARDGGEMLIKMREERELKHVICDEMEEASQILFLVIGNQLPTYISVVLYST